MDVHKLQRKIVNPQPRHKWFPFILHHCHWQPRALPFVYHPCEFGMRLRMGYPKIHGLIIVFLIKIIIFGVNPQFFRYQTHRRIAVWQANSRMVEKMHDAMQNLLLMLCDAVVELDNEAWRTHHWPWWVLHRVIQLAVESQTSKNLLVGFGWVGLTCDCFLYLSPYPLVHKVDLEISWSWNCIIYTIPNGSMPYFFMSKKHPRSRLFLPSPGFEKNGGITTQQYIHR